MPDYLDILNKYGLNKTYQPKKLSETNTINIEQPQPAITTNAAKAAIQSLIQNAVHGVKSTFYTLGGYLKGESIYSRKATLESLKSGQSTIVDLSSASQFGIPPSYYVVKSTDKPEYDGKTEKKGNETTVYVYKPKLEQEIKTLSTEYDEQIAKAIKEQSIIQEQKSIYAQTPFQKLVWDVAGMAYQTVGSVATIGLTSAIGVPQLGLAAVFASTAAQEGASLYLQGIESGIEHNDMATQSMIVGAVNGLVEMWGVGELVQWLSKPITSTAGKTAVDALVKKGLVPQAVSKLANIKFVEDLAISSLSEGLEEWVQGYASDIGLSSAQQKTARETIRTMIQNTPEHFYEFFIASLWGGADVAVNKVVGNYTRNAAAEIIQNRAEEVAENISKNVGGDKETIKKEVIKQVSNIAKATGNALSEAHKQLSEEDKKELAKVVKPEDLEYLKYLIMKTEGKAGLTKEDINNINQWVKKNLPTYLQNKAKDVDAIREIIDKAMKEEVKPVTLSAAINNLTAISKELDILNEVKIPKTALPTFNEIQSKIRQAIVDIHSNKNVLTQYKNIVGPLGQLTQTYLDLTKKAGQIVEETMAKIKTEKGEVVATLDDLIKAHLHESVLAGEAAVFVDISRDFKRQDFSYKGQNIRVPVTFSLLAPIGEQYTEEQLEQINDILEIASKVAERRNKKEGDMSDIAAAIKTYKKEIDEIEKDEVAKSVVKAVEKVVEKQIETTTTKAVEVSTEETVEVKPTEKVAEVQPVAEEPVSVQPTTKKITEKRTLHIPLSEDRLNTILQLLEKIRNVDRNSEARRAIEVLHDMRYAKTVEQIDAILKRAEEYLNKTEPAENPIPFSREEMLIRDITKWVKERKVPTVYEKGKQSKATETVETPAAPIETEKTVTQNVPEEAPTEVPPLQEETTAGVDEKEQKIRELQEQIPEDNREVKANIIKVDTTKYVTDATLKRIKLAESEIKEEQFKPSEIENYFGDLPSFIRGVLDKKHPSNGYAIFWGTLGDAFRNRALQNIDLEDLNQVPNDILKTRMNFQISDIVTPSKSYFQYMESQDGVGLAVFSNFKNQVVVLPSYVALVEEMAKENKINGAWYNDSDFLYFISGNKVIAALTSIEIEKFDYPPYRFPASEYPYLKPALEENEFVIDQELGRTLRATKEEKEIIIKKNEELKEADKEKQLTPEETKKVVDEGVKKEVLKPEVQPAEEVPEVQRVAETTPQEQVETPEVKQTEEQNAKLEEEINDIAKKKNYTIPPTPTYKLVNKDKYYKRKNNEKGEPTFIEVKNAKSIKIPNNEDLDFFITQDENTKKWIVYDGKTGLFITEGTTQKEAIENAGWEVKRHPNIKAIIEAYLPNFTPRYKVEMPTKTQTTAKTTKAKQEHPDEYYVTYSDEDIPEDGIIAIAHITGTDPATKETFHDEEITRIKKENSKYTVTRDIYRNGKFLKSYIVEKDFDNVISLLPLVKFDPTIEKAERSPLIEKFYLLWKAKDEYEKQKGKKDNKNLSDKEAKEESDFILNYIKEHFAPALPRQQGVETTPQEQVVTPPTEETYEEVKKTTTRLVYRNGKLLDVEMSYDNQNKMENAGTTETLSNTTNREFIQNVKIAWQKSKPPSVNQPDPLDNQIAYLKPEDVRYLFNKAKEYIAKTDEAEMQKANKVIKKLLNKELLAEREQEVIRLHKQQIEIEKGLAESPKTPQEELQAFKGIEAEDVMLDITPEEAELLLKRWLQERSQYEEYFAQHAGLIRRMDEIIIKLQTYPEALTESEMKTVMEAFPSIFKKEIKAKPANILGQALAFVKILKVSFDLSMAGRQGITMIGHPWLYLNSVYKMIRAADPIHGEEYFAKMMEQMKQHPDWNLAVTAQLQITEAEDVYTAIHNTLDLLTKGKYNPIRISERNAQAFLYYIRFSEFEYLMNLYRKAGIEPSAEIRNEIANFVNTITGRGDIKALPHSIWTIGSYVLYSPRLMASRVALMNPWTYLRLVFSEGGKYRVVGKEAIKMMAAFLAFIFGSLWLVKKLIPDSYVETDPTSADFGKFRVGNVHYDVTGGFAAYVVFISRIITGRLTSSTTLIPRFYGSQWGQGTKLDTLVRFAQSKLDPVLGLAASLLAGETYSGDPIPPMKQLLKPMEGKDLWYNLANHPIYSLATPLVIADFIDLVQNDDQSINKFLYALDLFGFGTQAYSVDITKSVQDNYNNLLKAGVSPQEATKRISYLKALNAYKQELNYLKNDTTLDEKTKKARLELLQKRLELARKVFIGGEK